MLSYGLMICVSICGLSISYAILLVQFYNYGTRIIIVLTAKKYAVVLTQLGYLNCSVTICSEYMYVHGVEKEKACYTGR